MTKLLGWLRYKRNIKDNLYDTTYRMRFVFWRNASKDVNVSKDRLTTYWQWGNKTEFDVSSEGRSSTGCPKKKYSGLIQNNFKMSKAIKLR